MTYLQTVKIVICKFGFGICMNMAIIFMLAAVGLPTWGFGLILINFILLLIVAYTGGIADGAKDMYEIHLKELQAHNKRLEDFKLEVERIRAEYDANISKNKQMIAECGKAKA